MDPPTYHTVHWNDCGDGSLSRLIYLLVGGGPKWLRANCLDSDDNGGSSSSSPPPLPSSPKVTPHLSVEAAVLSAPVPPTPYCCPLSTKIQQHVHPDHIQRWFTLAKPQPRGPGRENSEAWLTVIIRSCHTSTPSSTRRALSTFFAVAELPTENPGIVDIRRLSSLWYGGFCPLSPQIILTRICTRNLNVNIHGDNFKRSFIKLFLCVRNRVAKGNDSLKGGRRQSHFFNVNLPDWRQTFAFSQIQVQFDFQRSWNFSSWLFCLSEFAAD